MLPDAAGAPPLARRLHRQGAMARYDASDFRFSTPCPAGAPAARAAGLRHVAGAEGWIRRVGSGRGFRYVTVRGGAPSRAARRRIAALAIPPAWKDVRICPLPSGHVQATGRDARGRKQYRYHAAWISARNETKFERMSAFGEALPRIRRRVATDLARRGLPREKVLATVVRLLERSLIRVGCDEYARINGAHGLATLRDEHVRVAGAELVFRFRGKGGREHRVRVSDRRVARVVRRCRDLPGRELFQYLDEHGVRRRIDSGDVNAYLREIAGSAFTAKDFRTWGATLLAAVALHETAPAATSSARQRTVLRVLRLVSETLGNTPSVCRKFYVNPRLIAAYEADRLPRAPALRGGGSSAEARFAAAERALLAFLRDEAGGGRAGGAGRRRGSR